MKKLILPAAAVASLPTGAMAQTTVTTSVSRATVQIEPSYQDQDLCNRTQGRSGHGHEAHSSRRDCSRKGP
jgi:hypothetical protein